jgi:asparagine synthase (glutamine-hydrolysing)
MQFEEAVDEYGRLFQQAVSRQLMSDVEVGVLLSGGIDSALVASVAQQASDKPLRAFTVGFKDSNGTGIDEINGAGETAEYLGMEHLTMRISSEDFFETLRKSVQIVEEPLATTSIVPMHFLSKLAGNYVKVVMSGQGADEILGGYKRYQVELWRNLIPPFVANLGFKALRLFGSKNATLERGLRALSESDDVSRFLEAYQVFSDNEIVQLTGINSQPANDDIRYTYDLLQCAALPSSVQRMMCIDARLGLSDDLLLYTDKISMHESLECRVPILDLELVQFVESLPHEYRLGFGKGKIIHKEYAERVLPEEIVSRPKRGFLSPTNEWFKDEKMLRDLLLNRSSEFANHFDLSAVENIIRKHQSGFNQERQIFVLLCLSFCLENSR